MILDMAASSLLPFNSANRKALVSLCRLSRNGYEAATTHLYHTVILPGGASHNDRLMLFLRTIAASRYLAQKVVNLWIGDPELSTTSSDVRTMDETESDLVMPHLPNLQRFAINGQNSPICWQNLSFSCQHLTVADLKVLQQPIPTLRTLHLINSLLSPDALKSALQGCPALHSVVFELTEPFSEKVDRMMLMQLGVLVVKTVPRLRKLTFRIENFWIMHHTTRMLPAKLKEEGLQEAIKGKTIATVWSWELGMDFCDIWMANTHKQRVGKEHKICQ